MVGATELNQWPPARQAGATVSVNNDLRNCNPRVDLGLEVFIGLRWRSATAHGMWSARYDTANCLTSVEPHVSSERPTRNGSHRATNRQTTMHITVRAFLPVAGLLLVLLGCGDDGITAPDPGAEAPFEELYRQGIARYLGVFTPTSSSVVSPGTTQHSFSGADGPICYTGNRFSMFTRREQPRPADLRSGRGLLRPGVL